MPLGLSLPLAIQFTPPWTLAPVHLSLGSYAFDRALLGLLCLSLVRLPLGRLPLTLVRPERLLLNSCPLDLLFLFHSPLLGLLPTWLRLVSHASLWPP